MPQRLEFLNPPELGKHVGFSHGLRVQSNDLLFVAGQVGWNAQSKIVSAEFAAQFEQALANVLAVVRQAGGGPENVVRLTIYVLDCDEYTASLKAVGEAYRRLMGRHYPAMTLVEVRRLVEEGARLELEATAAL